MPNNVQERRVIWRCEECIEEKGPARCSFAIYQIRNKTGSDTQSKITRSKQQHAIQTEPWTLGTHDTIDGQITGLIQDISVELESTIEHIIKGQIISTHPDGHCLFRALEEKSLYQPRRSHKIYEKQMYTNDGQKPKNVYRK
jgi:hypothetical protein